MPGITVRTIIVTEKRTATAFRNRWNFGITLLKKIIIIAKHLSDARLGFRGLKKNKDVKETEIKMYLLY